MKNERVKAGGIGIVLGAIFLTTLVACTPVDEVYLKIEEAAVVFMTCEPIEAEAITVQRIPVGSRNVTLWEDAWVAEGSSTLGPAAELTFGLPPEGMRTVVDATSLLEGGWDVKLIVDGTAQDGRVINIVGEWQTSGLEQGFWYADDGNRLESAPCGAWVGEG